MSLVDLDGFGQHSAGEGDQPSRPRSVNGGGTGRPGADATGCRTVWGSYQVGLMRYGMVRRRLVVFPPGADRDERRAIRVWLSSALWAPLASIVVFVGLGTCHVDAYVGLCAAIAVGVGGWMWARHRAAAVRSGVRMIESMVVPSATDAGGRAREQQIRRWITELRAADSGLADGSLSPAQHECVWNRVHAEIDVALATPIVGQVVRGRR